MPLAYSIGAATVAIFLWMIWPALNTKKWGFATDLSRESLVWGALGVAVLVALFYRTPQLIPILIVAIMVHEYGHVLAFRLAGHREPKFRLVPFGGVAMSDEPAKTQAENAYVALMGPGFSLVLLVIAVMVELALDQAGDNAGAIYAAWTVSIVAILNAFNLLPFYPLDGGKALRAIAMTAGERAATTLTFAMSALFAGVAVALQLWILLLFAVFGLAAAFRPSRSEANATPMSPAIALLALAAYVVTTVAFFWAAWPFFFSILMRAGVIS